MGQVRLRARLRLLAFTAAACGLVAVGTAGAATTTTVPTTTAVTSSTAAPSTTGGASTTVGTAAPTTTTDVVAEATTTTTTALPELSVTADRSEGPQGTVVHLSGRGCVFFDRPAEWLSAHLRDVDWDNSDPDYGHMVRVVGPPADGTFEIDMTIPPEAFRGDYEIWVTCGVGDAAVGDVRLPFSVTGDQSTYAGLAVWPLTVRPGEDIGFGGEHCTDSGAPAARVYVYVNVPSVVPGVANRVVVPVRSDGSWFGLFTIPATTPQGTYDVTAFCSSASSTGGSDYDLPTAQIVVAGEPVPPSTAELPRTGTHTGTLAAVGACCTFAGLLLITTARRRRVAAV